MKFEPAHDVAMMSGKFCKKRPGYVAYNRKTGKMYRAVYHKRPDTNTDDQKAVRETFTTKSRAAASWWNANKPSTTNPQGTALFQQFKKMYDAQMEIGNPYSYCRSLIDDDCKIVIKGVAYAIDSTTPQGGGNNPNPNPQGGGGGDEDPDGEGSLS